MSTIVAISTAPGNSGIGIVRLSGEDSINIIKKIFMVFNDTCLINIVFKRRVKNVSTKN